MITANMTTNLDIEATVEEIPSVDTKVPDESIVLENDDEDEEEEDDDDEVEDEIPTKANTAVSGSFVQDWSVVEKPTNDSSSEFSDDDEYQVDLLLDEPPKRNGITTSICKSSICSSSDDESSCNDVVGEINDDEDNDDEDDDDEVVLVDGKPNEIAVVIENPLTDGDCSDFDGEEEVDDDSPLIDDGFVVDDDEECIVVHEQINLGDNGKDSYHGLPMRPRQQLITRISSVEGRSQ